MCVCEKEREREREREREKSEEGVPNISDVPFRKELTTQDALEAT